MDELQYLIDCEQEYDSKKEEAQKPCLQTYLNALENKLNEVRFELLEEYLEKHDLEGLSMKSKYKWEVETDYGRPDNDTIIPIPKHLGKVLDTLFGKEHPIDWEQEEHEDYGDSLVFYLKPKKKKRKRIPQN